MSWEPVATFDNTAAAELAKAALECHDIRALLQEGPVLTLVVSSEDRERAAVLLEQTGHLPQTDDEIEAAAAARPDIAARLADPRAAEPFVDNPTDRRVKQLVIVTVFGLLCLSTEFFGDFSSIVVFRLPLMPLLAIPLHLYALYLAWTLRRATPPVRTGDGWKIGLALALNVFIWGAVVVPVAFLVNRFHDPQRAEWRIERFGDLGGVSMTVGLPGPYGYALFEEKTALGPGRVRQFAVDHKNEGFLIDLTTLEEAAPGDPVEAAKRYLKRQLENAKVESLKPITLGEYRGVEASATYVAAVTNAPCALRTRAFVIDRYVISLTASRPADAEESAATARFFRSAQLH
jgi:hypothetical protein